MANMKFYWARIQFHDKWIPDGRWSEHTYRTNKSFKSFDDFLESSGFGEDAKKSDSSFEYKILEKASFDTYEELVQFEHDLEENDRQNRKLPKKDKNDKEPFTIIDLLDDDLQKGLGE